MELNLRRTRAQGAGHPPRGAGRGHGDDLRVAPLPHMYTLGALNGKLGTRTRSVCAPWRHKFTWNWLCTINVDLWAGGFQRGELPPLLGIQHMSKMYTSHHEATIRPTFACTAHAIPLAEGPGREAWHPNPYEKRALAPRDYSDGGFAPLMSTFRRAVSKGVCWRRPRE